MKDKQPIAIYFWLLLVPFSWGGTFVAVEHIVTEIPPITASTIRFGVAGIILLIYVIAQKSLDFNAIRKQWKTLLLMSVTGIFGYSILFFVALNITSAINGSLIIATSPVFITLGAVLLLGEVWNKFLGYGLALSLIGVIVVIFEGSLATLFRLDFNTGDLLFIAGLFLWVTYGLLGKIVMRDVSPMVTTTITALIGSVLLGISSLFEKGWGEVLHVSTQAWAEMAFIIIFSVVLGYLLWNYGIQQIGASKSSIYMNITPIITALLAVFLYGSSISLTQILGMIMVLIGVYFVTFHQYLLSKRTRRKVANLESAATNKQT